jgi:tetratricopeptide (TPR) repeat protein/CHAT domain-containing protein
LQPLTPQERQELERKGHELHEAALKQKYRGEYELAFVTQKQALSISERLYPKEQYPRGHPTLAASLHNMGALLQARGDLMGARECFQRSLGMHEALYPKEQYPHGHELLAHSLNGFGSILKAQADYEGARGYYLRALKMRQALYPKNRYPQGHLDLAVSLSNLGTLLEAQGDYDGARSYLQQALAMKGALYPKDRFPRGHPDLAESLNNLGALLNHQGDYGGALGYYERALAMYQALYSRDRYPHGHPHLATSLNNLGALLEAQGDYDGARSYLQQALAMNEALYPKDRYPQGHPDLATSLNNLGALLKYQGDYGGARGYYERALAMRQALYPKDRCPQGHPDLATSLHNLGGLLWAQGDYGGARGYYERALAMYQALYPADRYPQGHPHLANSLHNLGSLLWAQRDYGRTRGYLEWALAMRQALYPKDRYPQGHPDLPDSLNALGLLLVAQGDYGGARGYYERALAMNQALYPKTRYPRGHLQLAANLNNLGTLLMAQGDYNNARGYLERALAMKGALYPKDRYPQGHPDLAQGLLNLGGLLWAQGDYGGARGYYERALAMYQALYPADQYPQGHPDLASSTSNLGTMLESAGQLTAALPLLQRAVDMYEDQAELFQRAVSEAESYDYLASLPGTIQGLISVSCRCPGQAEATYARVWRNKAAVARVLQYRNAAITLRADADARRTLESWRDVRRQIARLMLATSDGRDDPGRVQRLRRLTADKERLERTLATAILEFAREQALARSPHTRLIELLPPGMVILDMVAFNRFAQDPDVPGEKGRSLTRSYVGFVLAKGQPVQQVDLGPAQPIDEAVRAWRAAIDRRQASPTAEVVRRKVWEPLAQHFPPGMTTVLIAPDWLLTAVPWGALPGDRPGTVLLEQYALAIVPHAPFVLDRLTAPARSPGESDLVLAVGGVDYNGTPQPLGDPAARTDLLTLRRAETERGRGPGGGEGWKDLPGTGREVEVVAKLAGTRPLLRLEGTEANTARLLRELPRVRWAHVATHGFFADPKVRSILQPDPKLFAFEGRQRAAGLRNPLVLSGLVLAGANRSAAAVAQADQAGDDLGIVTAEAIAGLPLQDLDLAVLSACETGLGLVGSGEGVFGLQRAFHLAGAHNVVASLWKVDDEATAALMALFYDRLWRQNKPPIEALRDAQLMLYRHPELVGRLATARGTPDFDKVVQRPESGPGSGEPARKDRAPLKQWAAFVLSGWGK